MLPLVTEQRFSIISKERFLFSFPKLTSFDVIIAPGRISEEVIAVVVVEELLSFREAETTLADHLDIDHCACRVSRSVLTISPDAEDHHFETEKRQTKKIKSVPNKCFLPILLRFILGVWEPLIQLEISMRSQTEDLGAFTSLTYVAIRQCAVRPKL